MADEARLIDDGLKDDGRVLPGRTRGRGAATPLQPGRSRLQPPGPAWAHTMLRTASGAREAVVKVISYAAKPASVQSLVDYITRKGELDLETKEGATLRQREGRDGSKEQVNEWARSFSDNSRARNAVHVMASAPPGSDPEAVKRAARAFGERIFGKGRDYGFAFHAADEDSKHPHVHFVVVRDGPDAKSLGWNKAELQAMREAWAEEGTEQGISMIATPRASRGRAERAERMEARKAREREGASWSDRSAAAEVLAEGPEGSTERPWEARIAARATVEREAYEELAAFFDRMGDRLGQDETGKTRTAAALVRRQAMAMRQALTRREHMRRLATQHGLFGAADRVQAVRDLARHYREDRAEREQGRGSRNQGAQDREPIVPATPEAMREKLEAFRREAGRRVDELAERGDADAREFRRALDRQLGRQRWSRGRDDDFEMDDE